MAAKGAAAGKAFLAGVLQKLPAELRGEAAKLFENADLQTYVGDGTLALEDFTRQSDALRTQAADLDTRKTQLDEREDGLQNWHERLSTWYGANKTLLDSVRAGGGTPNPANPNPANPNPANPANPTPANPATPAAFTEAAYNDRIRGEREAFLGFQRDQNQITREHFAKFGEIVDLESLLAHPRIGDVGLVGVYELVHKDRLDKWKTDAAKAAEDKIRQDERQKVLAQQAQMPYPTPTGPGSGSPLDAIKPSAADGLVDSAVAEYNRLQAERNAGTGART